VLGLCERTSGDSRSGASSFFIWCKAWSDAAERARLAFAARALPAPGGLLGADRSAEGSMEVGDTLRSFLKGLVTSSVTRQVLMCMLCSCDQHAQHA